MEARLVINSREGVEVEASRSCVFHGEQKGKIQQYSDVYSDEEVFEEFVAYFTGLLCRFAMEALVEKKTEPLSRIKKSMPLTTFVAICAYVLSRFQVCILFAFARHFRRCSRPRFGFRIFEGLGVSSKEKIAAQLNSKRRNPLRIQSQLGRTEGHPKSVFSYNKLTPRGAHLFALRWRWRQTSAAPHREMCRSAIET